jgi:XisH protein
MTMPAYDVFHGAVRKGLIKEGWTITDDPLVIEFGTLDVYIDLAAERLIGAEKGGERIAVEVKSFLGPSLVTDFHAALGQFLNYRLVLDNKDPDRALYLAVPKSTFTAFFTLLLAQMAVRRHGVHIIVYDPELEALVQWIEQNDIAS